MTRVWAGRIHITNSFQYKIACRFSMDIERSPITLRQLHYFVAVADRSSFTRGAEAIHVAQPALSRQIASLEGLVGVRLLLRTRKGLSLTEAGKRLYEVARSVLERIEGVQAEIGSSVREPAGVVRIALPITVAAMLVPMLVREVEKRYPGIVLRIQDGLSFEGASQLEDGQLDLGLLPNADEFAGLVSEPLLREDLFLVRRKEAGARLSKTISIRQLVKLPLVMAPRSQHLRRFIEQAANEQRLELNLRYEQHSATTIAAFVADGLAATIANSPAVSDFWRPGTVVAQPIRPALRRVVSLAWSVGRPLGFAALAVSQVVKDLALRSVREGRWTAVVV